MDFNKFKSLQVGQTVMINGNTKFRGEKAIITMIPDPKEYPFGVVVYVESPSIGKQSYHYKNLDLSVPDGEPIKVETDAKGRSVLYFLSRIDAEMYREKHKEVKDAGLFTCFSYGGYPLNGIKIPKNFTFFVLRSETKSLERRTKMEELEVSGYLYSLWLGKFTVTEALIRPRKNEYHTEMCVATFKNKPGKWNQVALNEGEFFNGMVWFTERKDEEAGLILIKHAEESICKLEETIEKYQYRISLIKQGVVEK